MAIIKKRFKLYLFIIIVSFLSILSLIDNIRLVNEKKTLNCILQDECAIDYAVMNTLILGWDDIFSRDLSIPLDKEETNFFVELLRDSVIDENRMRNTYYLDAIIDFYIDDHKEFTLKMSQNPQDSAKLTFYVNDRSQNIRLENDINYYDLKKLLTKIYYEL